MAPKMKIPESGMVPEKTSNKDVGLLEEHEERLIYLRERRAKQKGKDGVDENYLKNFELLDDPLENKAKKNKL